MNRSLILRTPDIRDRAAAYVASLPVADPPWEVAVKPFEEPRTPEQNSCMWGLLTDLSKQVEWPVNGRMQYVTPEDWKQILSAGLEKEQRVAQGIDGGFVMLGTSTSKMGKKRMSALIELIQFFGDSRGVKWTPPESKAA